MNTSRAAPFKAHVPHTGAPVNVGFYEVIAAGTQYQIGECFEDPETLLVPLTQELPGLFGREYRVLWAPLKDFGGAPADWSDLLRGVIDRLASGQKLLAYCAGSHGRTGMFLASLIALLEDEAQTPDPIAAVRQRHCEQAVETLPQIEAVFALRGQPVPPEYQHGRDVFSAMPRM